MSSLVTLLNIKISNVTKDALLVDLKSGVVFTPNVDHLIKLQKNIAFYNAYKKADWVVCDSKVLNLFSRFLHDPIIETIPGSSFFPAFYTYHKDNPDYRYFLLGAAEGVGAAAQEKINNRVEKEIVIGNYSPPFGFEFNDKENDRIINIINESKATVLVVGFGAPKQELWISNNKERLHTVKIILALGATIDFEAGHIKRAPRLYQKFGLEWLYRLYKEPKRMFKRYLIEDMEIFSLVLAQKLKRYKNPFND